LSVLVIGEPTAGCRRADGAVRFALTPDRAGFAALPPPTHALAQFVVSLTGMAAMICLWAMDPTIAPKW
jgi:hypothetical protein